MKKSLIKIENLNANVDSKKILKDFNLEIFPGEIHVIMGPNGAGKSTLGNVLMGNPIYQVVSGNVTWQENTNFLDLSTDQRSREGLFLSFQYPEEISGVTVENFLRTAKNLRLPIKQSISSFKKELLEKMDLLSIPHEYKNRYLNLGFSGGEKKKNEMLQLAILNPKLSILDETDSGLDVDAIKIIYENIQKLMDGKKSFLIITHYSKILDYINPDFVHVMMDGKIIKTSDSSLGSYIDQHGYESLRTKN